MGTCGRQIGNCEMPNKNETANYLLLIASTGSILAAINAGIIPDNIPSTIHKASATTIVVTEIMIGKGRILVSTRASIQTSVRPNKPPIIHRNALSSKTPKVWFCALHLLLFLNRFDWCVHER